MNPNDTIKHMKYTNEILKYLRRHNPHLMGIAAFNREEMHRRWQDYCRRAPKIERDDMIYFLVGTKNSNVFPGNFPVFSFREVMFRISMIRLISIISIK